MKLRSAGKFNLFLLTHCPLAQRSQCGGSQRGELRGLCEFGLGGLNILLCRCAGLAAAACSRKKTDCGPEGHFALPRVYRFGQCTKNFSLGECLGGWRVGWTVHCGSFWVSMICERSLGNPKRRQRI